jgi:hypothetical protein
MAAVRARARGIGIKTGQCLCHRRQLHQLVHTEPKPRGKCFRSSARVGHNVRMAHAPNFKLALTRTIEPTGGPGGELATLEDAARFVVQAPGTTALGFCSRTVAEGRGDRKKARR